MPLSLWLRSWRGSSVDRLIPRATRRAAPFRSPPADPSFVDERRALELLAGSRGGATEAYEPITRGRDGGVREELAAGVALRSGGRSAFGGKPENIYSF